jgi:hypothetical protein
MTKRHIYPGFDVVEAPEDIPVQLVAGENIAIPYESRRHGTLWHLCRINSVVSYAMRYGECPVEALDRARKINEKLWWINKLPTTIDGLGRPKVTYTGLKEGQIIRFEGRIFRIKGTDIVTLDTSEASA